MSTDRESDSLVLVTGATGYIGAHLVGPLKEAGYPVRVAARSPQRLSPGVRRDADEVVAADALDPVAVAASLEGVHTAFYLVHTLGSGSDYAERDRAAAAIFAQAARDASVKRIVFLGGLGQDVGALSEHLASRHEVGRVLASSGIDVVELRASVVIGSGSTSFEMIRNLTEKLRGYDYARVGANGRTTDLDEGCGCLRGSVGLSAGCGMDLSTGSMRSAAPRW